MSDYTKTTNFTAKDALSTGDPNKIILGADFDTEYDALETAIATKANKITSAVTNDLILQSASGDLVAAGYGLPNVNADITASDEELNLLDGATVTTAEINILDGVTSTAAELNILDGVTSTTAELNLLDGVTATTAELNITAGLTATTAELNSVVDGCTATAAEITAICDGRSLASSDDTIDNFPSGTLMLFQQTAAPTGWTKQTTYNDRALRVVSGTASSGGSSSFTTVFGITATDSYTLTESDIPAHTHTVAAHSTTGGSSNLITRATSAASVGSSNHTSSSTGGGGGHSHDIDLRVQYVDLIIASKN